jgi:endonuclease I
MILKNACSLSAIATLLTLAGFSPTAFSQDEFSPPESYYAGATGTGLSLKTQLRSAMSAGHIQRAYGDFRNSSVLHDQDPDNPGNILLAYNRVSVSGTWNSGVTWNREHVWPQSRQPGSASNSTRGNLGDPHSLLPCNPSINSSRGNKPFGGGADTTGNHRSLGTFYFPGDADKGDVARSLFYSDTRYGSSTMTLVDGNPSGNQMGDLESLLAWHYLDAPDTFERRRNHVIYSPILNPVFRSNNRNAFIDHPEYVWSVYVDQMNDSTLWFGDLEPADGASTIDLDLGNLIVDDTIDPMSFVLNKSGDAGTFYSVEASEGLTSSITGSFNSFAMSSVNLSTVIEVSLDTDSTATAGSYAGDVRVNNLDITTMGGAGNGANDIDDVIFVQYDVFFAGNASFDSETDTNSLSIDLGTINIGAGDASQLISLFNIAQGGEFGAPVDVSLISSVGDTDAISTNFTPINSLTADSESTFVASLDDTNNGEFTATYVFQIDNDLSMFQGVTFVEQLTLIVSGQVGSECLADFAEPFGQLNFFDVSAFLSAYSSNDTRADLNNDGEFNFFDVSEFLNLYGAGCP